MLGRFPAEAALSPTAPMLSGRYIAAMKTSFILTIGLGIFPPGALGFFASSSKPRTPPRNLFLTTLDRNPRAKTEALPRAANVSQFVCLMKACTMGLARRQPQICLVAGI